MRPHAAGRCLAGRFIGDTERSQELADFRAATVTARRTHIRARRRLNRQNAEREGQRGISSYTGCLEACD